MYDIVYKIKNFLVDFLKENKKDLKASNTDEMLNNNYWKQAKNIFTTMALLLDYAPDTSSGDRLLLEVFTTTELDKVVDRNDFDLYMWSDMC